MTDLTSTTSSSQATSMRTHLCGELRPDHIGQTVSVCGWVGRRREHGEHLAFVDLRDHSGIVQCVINDDVDVRSEYVLRVTGVVRERPEGTVNENLPTGHVELGECHVEVLRKADPPPFGKYAELWLKDYIKTTKRASTFQRYTSIFEAHINPVIGRIRLDELKRSDVRALALKLYSNGLSRSSVSTAKNVISGVLEYAMDAELIRTNVSKGVLRKLGLDSHQGREAARGMTPAEVELLLGDASKARTRLGWEPTTRFAALVEMMVDADLAALAAGDRA